MLTLCERGHDVALMKERSAGRYVVPAAAPKFKIDMQDYLRYLQIQAKNPPARILLNTEATKELWNWKTTDALIIAVGADPIVPQLPGIDKPHVHWAPDADMGLVEVGENSNYRCRSRRC